MPAKILLSFAMANHGANFANWLRDRLMKHYHLYHVDAVYMDSVVSRSGETRHAMSFKDAPPAPMGVASVSPDDRLHVRSETGAMPIGATREDWNRLYKTAMAEAEVMLFAFTDEYKASIWCMKEWGQFQMENKNRRMRRQAPLRGIILAFNNDINLLGLYEAPVMRIQVAKTDGGRRGLAWDVGDFILNDEHFRLLVQTIGPLRP